MSAPPTLFDAAAPVVGAGELGDDDRARVAGWDRDIELLLDEARRSYQVDLDVPLPASLSASAVVRLARDPAGLARDLARPMPRPPAPAAARGTRFHAWVESLFDVVPLIDRTDLAGAADDVLDDEELASLQAAFLGGPYAGLAPHRVEAPFQLVLGDRVVRGRIDAVYRTAAGYDVVDWKTGRSSADPLQLAVYRLAWARVAGVPVESVGAAFYYVATGQVVRPDDLPDAAELAALLGGDVEPRSG
jgi:DNA helicase-2/ATP-dependent DNA helicase PcrA